MPAASVTVQITKLSPSEYGSVESLVAGFAPTLSAIVGVPRTTPVAVDTPASVGTVTLTGAVIVGSSSSITVTV